MLLPIKNTGGRHYALYVTAILKIYYDTCFHVSKPRLSIDYIANKLEFVQGCLRKTFSYEVFIKRIACLQTPPEN